MRDDAPSNWHCPYRALGGHTGAWLSLRCMEPSLRAGYGMQTRVRQRAGPPAASGGGYPQARSVPQRLCRPPGVQHPDGRGDVTV